MTESPWTSLTCFAGYGLARGQGWCLLTIKEPSPLEYILDQVTQALDAGFPYLALTVALSVPDICATLQLDRTKGLPKTEAKFQYLSWCSKYLQKKFHCFDAKDMWVLRSGVLHNGMVDGHPEKNKRYSKIEFLLPGYPGLHDENVIVYGSARTRKQALTMSGSTIQLDLAIFVGKVVQSAREWSKDFEHDRIVVTNLRKLVRLRANGSEFGSTMVHPFIG